MGDPKFSRRKYQTPTHPWQGERIKGEDEYVRKFGLKNKKEFWKAESLLRDQRAQARHYLPLVLRGDTQGKLEADALLGKLNRLGVLQEDAGLDDVLALQVDSILSRRLQTVAFLKGLATTPTQARQLIVHGHIAIGGRRVNVPGYLVTRGEENAVEYAPTSPLLNEAHPVRQGQYQTHETEPGEFEGDDETEAEKKHRALKMAEEAEAEDKEDVLEKEPDEKEKQPDAVDVPKPEADEPDADEPEADEAAAEEAPAAEASDEGEEAKKDGGDAE